MLLSTRNDTRSSRRGEAHPLFLVELWILEGCKPLELIQKRSGQAALLDKKALREDAFDDGRQRNGGKLRGPQFRLRARPWDRLFFLIQDLGKSRAHYPTGAGGFLRDQLGCARFAALNRL